MGDLHATTLAVFKPLGHFPNTGIMLHNIHFKFQIHVYLYEQHSVKTKNTYFSSEGKL